MKTLEAIANAAWRKPIMDTDLKKGDKFTITTPDGVEWETAFDPDNPETFPAYVREMLFAQFADDLEQAEKYGRENPIVGRE